MIKALLIVVASAVVAISGSGGVYAQKNTFDVAASVRDAEDNLMITDATYRLVRLPDSALVRQGEAFSIWESGSYPNFTKHYSNAFKITDLPIGTKYALELSCPGYQTLWVEVDPTDVPKKSYELALGTLRLEKVKTLREVAVTATKVKFYNKGDTLVYNADAFVLAEGSMLDALIAQLPGAEIKAGGQIYVNGRFVESLLLNGKDFFKGNNQVMLDNLGAYTVKNIEVYDGQEEMDRIIGKGYGKRIYTMNVTLKKEYMEGLLLNIEGGYGIKDMYLGRVFAMLYNKQSRVTLFGNVNNIASPWKPDGEYSAELPSPESDELRTYMGGVDYNVQIARTPYSVDGSAEAKYTRQVYRVSQYVTNFLPGGDTYGYDFSRRMSKSFAFNTTHNFKAKTDTWNMQVNPNFSYNRNKNLSSLISGTFTREWDGVDAKFLEGLYSNSTSDVIASVINRSRQNRDDFGHTMKANVWSNGKFKRGSDAFTYLVAYTYNRLHSDSDEDFLINYGSDPAKYDGQRRHFHNHPEYNWRAKGSAGYIWNAAKGLFVDMYYTYQRYVRRAVSELYQDADYLESIGDGVSSMLPSAFAANWTPDAANSFDSRYREETHDVNFDFSWNIKPIETDIRLKVPLSARRQWLHYMRGDVDARLGRDKFFLGDLSLDASINGIKDHMISVYLRRLVTSPDMVDMVDFTNDLDPLNIRKGNPSLRDASKFTLRIVDRWRLNREMQRWVTFAYDLYTFSNSLAYGYTYDPATGVKTGSMYNVNGNLDMTGLVGYMSAFGKNKCMFLETAAKFNYQRSADLISTVGAPTKNIVNKYMAREVVYLSYQNGSNRIMAMLTGDWSRYTSGQSGFVPFNALNFTYGLQANIGLPANFSVNTSFTVYSRRGYLDSSLNDDSFVWNARLSYSACRGNLIFMLDGFDILHNLKDITHTVNAQARTERYLNLMSRYVMFHVQWKFHRLPKGTRK